MNHISTRRFQALVGATGLVLLCSGLRGVSAQQPTLPRNQQELEKAVGITPAQKTQMQAVDKKYQPKMQALQKKYQPQFTALQRQIVALQQKAAAEAKPVMESRKNDIEKILTPAQREKLKNLDAQLKAQQQQKMMGANGGGMPSLPGKTK